MQAYKAMISENTTIVLSTNSDLFKFLKGMDPDSVGRPSGDQPSGRDAIVRPRQIPDGGSS